jgi:hypothetical protein
VLPGQQNRQANSISAHVRLPLAVNSKSERYVNSLPLLEFEPAIFRMLVHLSDRSAKSHPLKYLKIVQFHLDQIKWAENASSGNFLVQFKFERDERGVEN